jgi:hypothetical protein
MQDQQHEQLAVVILLCRAWQMGNAQTPRTCIQLHAAALRSGRIPQHDSTSLPEGLQAVLRDGRAQGFVEL